MPLHQVKKIKKTRIGVFGTIKHMIHIWQMWRMVHKLRKLQKIYMDRERRGIVNIDKRNISFMSKTMTWVPRDNLALKKINSSVILGSKEKFQEAPREFDKSQEIIDSCIDAKFIHTMNNPKDVNDRMIALTGRGITFLSFSYFLKYMITELGVVWTFSVSVIASFMAGGIMNELWDIIRELINKIRL